MARGGRQKLQKVIKSLKKWMNRNPHPPRLPWIKVLEGDGGGKHPYKILVGKSSEQYRAIPYPHGNPDFHAARNLIKDLVRNHGIPREAFPLLLEDIEDWDEDSSPGELEPFFSYGITFWEAAWMSEVAGVEEQHDAPCDDGCPIGDLIKERDLVPGKLLEIPSAKFQQAHGYGNNPLINKPEGNLFLISSVGCKSFRSPTGDNHSIFIRGMMNGEPGGLISLPAKTAEDFLKLWDAFLDS